MDNQKINLQYTSLTTPLPDFIYKGIKEYSKNANGYRPQPIKLIEKLSKKYGGGSDSLYLTAGADEAIQMFALAFGQKAYFFTPSYIVYSDSTDFYANITAINALYDNDYVISTKSIPDATLIYLANPNSPFGFTSIEKVLELVTNNSHAIVVVDEVYAEFSNLSVISEIKNYPNLAVLRSFSKSYGMAGNRIGFIAANQEIIKKVTSKAQWSNVSYLSVGAAITALEHESYFKNQINDIVKRREYFSTFLKKNKFNIFPSKINAVLIKFDREEQGTRFAQYLSDNNITISHGNGNSNTGLDNSFVRISIGSNDEMIKVSDIIKNYTPSV